MSYHFDTQAADDACLFFERFLRHVEGEWAQPPAKPIKLEAWQADRIIRPLFGWKNSDGTRKYRTCYVEIPRKNGKSTLAAGVALLLLFTDKEPGGQVFSAAGDREQAAIVFEMAKKMVLASPALESRADIFKRSIVCKTTNSYYKVLSSETKTKHGFGPSGIIFDELHVQANRELWDYLNTGTGSRRQPLTFALTTAGFDEDSICWQVHEHAVKVLENPSLDETFLPIIYGATLDDDWTSEEVWKKANPNYGISLKRESLVAECNKAKLQPSDQNTFKRLHLNIWTAQQTLWLDMTQWDACATPVDLDSLVGRPCWAGLDLAATTDITALSLIFPPQNDDEPYKFAWWFWIPEDSAVHRERRDRVPYQQWATEGHIERTDGNVVNYEAIKIKLRELSQRFVIQGIGYDPWNATQVAIDLQGEGYQMLQFRQGFVGYTEPSKEFERLIVSGQIAHGGNPIARWMASNVSVKTDPAGNIKPCKPEHASNKRIDGICAAIMALGLATKQEPVLCELVVI